MDKNKSVPASVGLENILLREKTSQIQKNPSERLIFSQGILAKGHFVPKKNLSEYTPATVFTNDETPVLLRFSTMTDNSNDGVKGLSVKFLTENGDWDLVCSNVPVAALYDGKKFPEYLSALQNHGDSTDEWLFYGQNPETLHHLLIAKSGRSFSRKLTETDGYSGNAYSLLSKNGTRHWVKFHLKANYKETPSWTVFIQILTEEQAQNFSFDPFDATKVWPHADCPLLEIGEIILDEMDVANYRNTVFSPANIIPGIGFSPDQLLLSRLAVYGDAQRKRLGENYPAKNDFEAFEAAIASLKNTEADYSHYEGHDPYMQAGLFYTKALKTDEERTALIRNIISSMNNIQSADKQNIIFRQLCHFFRANVELGVKIAMGLGINIDMSMMAHMKEM